MYQEGERERERGGSRERRVEGARLNPDGNINFDCNIKSSVVEERIILVGRLFWRSLFRYANARNARRI